MSHLKRLRTSKQWPMEKRKGITFVARAMPGPHKLSEAVTLNHLLVEMLKCAKNRKEAKLIINQGKVLVGNQVRKEVKFPVGVMDTISIQDNNEFYILLHNKLGKFTLVPIKKDDTSNKLCKIIGKKTLKGKKIQINFHNGNNLLVAKDVYKVGDTLMIEGKKIKKHLKLEKGSLIYLTAGKSKGKTGTLEKIGRSSELSKDTVTIKCGKENIVTTKDYAFVIEKEFKQ